MTDLIKKNPKIFPPSGRIFLALLFLLTVTLILAGQAHVIFGAIFTHLLAITFKKFVV